MADLTGMLSPGWNQRKTIHPDVAFLEEIKCSGFEINQIIPDGEIHRCHIDGDKRGSVNGWYCFYSDNIPAGVYGTWKEDGYSTWCHRDIDAMGHIERQVLDQRIAAARKLREQERKKTNENAADRAELEISEATPAASSHPYLQGKHVRPHSIYQSGDVLIIPVRDVNGQIQSLQRIGLNGDKLYMKGGKKAGGMHMIGTIGDTVYLVEGYATGATIFEATGTATVCAFDAGGLVPVAMALRLKHPAARIVICADNDQFTDGNPGITKATEAARAAGGSVVFPVFESLDGGPTDFNDLATREGIAAVLEQVTSSSGEPPGMQFLSLLEIRNGLKGAQYLIKPFLERETTAVLFGESGTYKSFICLDIGLCIAHGIPYHGHRTHQGPVFYICGEGSGGIARRIEAWTLAHPEVAGDDAPFYVSKVAGRLIDDGNAACIAESIRQQAPGCTPSLIIIDTLSTNIGNGDESSNPDVAKLMNNVNANLRDSFGSCVLIVHHVGHSDKDRERGAYALRGNADARIQVKHDGDYRCSIHSLKVKDGPEFDPVAFSARVVSIPGLFDSEGEVVASLVLDRDEYVDPVKVCTDQQHQAFEALKSMFLERRKNLEDRGEDISLARVEINDWYTYLEEHEIIKSGASRQAKNKLKTALKKEGLIDSSGRDLILLRSD